MAISSTQFKLLRREKDPKFNIDHLEHYDLLLQVGFSDLQLCITDTRVNRILLIEDYIMPGVNTQSDRVECLECLFDDHHLLLAGFWNAVRILVKNKKFSLVPDELFVEENARDYIQLNAALDPEDRIYFNRYQSLGLTNTFAVNEGVCEFVNNTYPNTKVSFYHQSTSLLYGNNKYFIGSSDNVVCLYLDRFILHVCVIKKGGIKFYNQYGIKKFEDYFRFIGFVVNELGIDSKDDSFHIWGYLSENSSHFKSLKSKYPKLSFGKRPEGLKMGYVFDGIPDHQYFDLLSLNQIN